MVGVILDLDDGVELPLEEGLQIWEVPLVQYKEEGQCFLACVFSGP